LVPDQLEKYIPIPLGIGIIAIVGHTFPIWLKFKGGKGVATSLGVFLAALALKIFVKIKIQYPKLIFNGTVVLFLAISLLYLNYLIVGQGQFSQIFIFN